MSDTPDPIPGAGNVPIMLDGIERELVPTVEACIRISAIHGGLNGAIARIRNLDLETMCSVIAAGLNLNPVRAKLLPNSVFKSGMIALMAPCVEFVYVVSNGGKPLPDADDDDQEGEGEDEPDPLMPA